MPSIGAICLAANLLAASISVMVGLPLDSRQQNARACQTRISRAMIMAAGNLHVAAIGIDRFAIWLAGGGGLQAQIDNLARRHGNPVKSVWPMPMPERDGDTVLEKHQGQVAAELDHRVKNVLARVAAVAMYTGQSSRTKEKFLHTLDGRIQSLANAHALLSHGRWQGVGLADLVRHQLAPYTNAGNTTIDGPPKVMLTAAATEAVAMVLHELVTNAAKYGALSTPQGRVSVTWSRGSNGRLSEGIVIKWRETGGPLVTPPRRLGHGTDLIRDLIPDEIGGVVDLAFTAEGVTCNIKLLPAQLTNQDQ